MLRQGVCNCRTRAGAGFPAFRESHAARLPQETWNMTVPDSSPSLEGLLTHSEWLATLARRLVVDRSAADDLVQDTWLAALRNPPREVHSLQAWLSRVARRLARVRDPLRRGCDACVEERESVPSTDEVVSRIEEERRLARLVLELEEPYRTVVLQRFYQGLSSVRIARIEHVPEATVRTRTRRALGLLRERLDRESGSERRAWPLASLFLARDGALTAIDKGVLMISSKTTIALSVATGALCALAVTEGILPRLGRPVASMAARASAETEERGVLVPEEAVDAAAPRSGIVRVQSTAVPGSTGRRAESDQDLSTEELRKLLASSRRIDQVRAIELLLRDGSTAANRILVDAFLTSKDSVLLALLGEALLASPLAFAPTILEAF